MDVVWRRRFLVMVFVVMLSWAVHVASDEFSYAQSEMATYDIRIDGGTMDVVSLAQPVLTGTVNAPDGTPVTVSIGNASMETSVSRGTWSLQWNTPLKDGKYVVLVAIKNTEGISSSSSQDLWVFGKPNSIAFQGGANVRQFGEVTVVAGKAEAPDGLQVVLSTDSKSSVFLGSTLVQRGEWKVVLARPLKEGVHPLRAQLMFAGTQRAVARQTVNVVLTRTKIVIEKPTASFVNPYPVISGTIATNQSTALTISINEKTRTLRAKNGKWKYVIDSFLPVGQYQICVTVDRSFHRTLSGQTCKYFATAYQTVSHRSYLRAFSDGTLRPDNLVRRAQFAEMLVQLIEQQRLQVYFPINKLEPQIRDMGAKHPQRRSVRMAIQMGLMKLDQNGRFRPDQFVSSVELRSLLDSMYRKTKQLSRNSRFMSDLDSFVTTQKLKSGRRLLSGQFPSRAEVVVLFNRLFARGPIVNAGASPWNDVSIKHWAFADLIEAATTHVAVRTNEGEWLFPRE